jgi:hypothetical protein
MYMAVCASTTLNLVASFEDAQKFSVEHVTFR